MRCDEKAQSFRYKMRGIPKFGNSKQEVPWSVEKEQSSIVYFRVTLPKKFAIPKKVWKIVKQRWLERSAQTLELFMRLKTRSSQWSKFGRNST
jgi:hypothetical protein